MVVYLANAATEENSYRDVRITLNSWAQGAIAWLQDR